MKKLLATTAFGAFLAIGPMQQAGVLPVTAVGNASLATVAMALDLTVSEAAACPNGPGGTGNKSKGGGNNPGKGAGKS